jgi:hypothetical protein
MTSCRRRATGNRSFSAQTVATRQEVPRMQPLSEAGQCSKTEDSGVSRLWVITGDGNSKEGICSRQEEPWVSAGVPSSAWCSPGPTLWMVQPNSKWVSPLSSLTHWAMGSGNTSPSHPEVGIASSLGTYQPSQPTLTIIHIYI